MRPTADGPAREEPSRGSTQATWQLLADKLHALAELTDSVPTQPGDCLSDVQALRMIAETATSALRQAVPLARAEGHTWSDIAAALDEDTHTVRERYDTF